MVCVPLLSAKEPTIKVAIPITIPMVTPQPIHVDIPNLHLVKAIIFVESSGNNNAYCASEDAVGCMQIRRVMVRDVNRIVGYKKYKLKDRWDRDKSIEIFNIYCSHYNLTTPEQKARAWNGGPRGYKKKSTQHYWNKVKSYLAKSR